MNSKLKVFIIVCCVVFLTGLAATVTGMALHGWRDLDKLPGNWHINEGSGNTKTYSLSGDEAKFEAMDLNLALCDVEYKQGDEYKIDLTYDAETTRPDISITDGTLVVKTNDEHYISGDKNGFTMTLEITVPTGTSLSKADLSMDACQVDLSDLDAKNLDLSMDIGELTSEDLTFDTAKFSLNLCDATLKMAGETADYDYDIESGLGSVSLEGDDIEKAFRHNNAPFYYDLETDLSDVTIDYQWPAGN